MDWVKCEMKKEVYFKIPSEIRESIEILQVEPKDFDYSHDDKWKLAKSESTKAYKKLKEIEYKIRYP